MKRLLAILLTLTTLGCLGVSSCKNTQTQDPSTERQAIGRFYTLQEAYDQGFITENDLKSIAYYNNGGRENNEDKIEEDFVSQPLNPKTIPADIQKNIKSDYIYYNDKLENTEKDSSVRINNYYGSYNDTYVLTLRGPFGYAAVIKDFSVSGYKFYYTQEEFMVWRKQPMGKLYTLQGAFDRGFITENDLKSIAYYNNGGRENNEDKIAEDFTPQPLNPETIPADIQRYVKSDYVYYNEKLENTEDISKVKINRYYGNYNGAYVLTLCGPFGYAAVINDFSVGGYNFYYTQEEFMVWRK